MPGTERLRSALAERYVIERELGSGGMATVYLARDIKHDREVAVKVLRPELSAVIGTQRFLSEVRIAAKLDHPHILTLIDSGEADGILYYILPYVRGENLRAKLEREKQLAVDDAVSIIRQIASALDYAHSQGVVHRDIKPENILLHQGEAVLADFGIALAVQAAAGHRLTETGLSLGTPLYMSPEQGTGDRLIDARSDVYSLGAVFYEMLAGEPPLNGPTAQSIIAKLLTERPISLRVVRPAISSSIEAATDKALAKTPADRFSSAGEFVRALSAAPSIGRKRSIRNMTRVVGAIVVVALVTVAVWLAGHGLTPASRAIVTLRDRTQVTTTGDVRMPALSPDGKSFAYVSSSCRESGCRYSIQMQDVGGTGRLLVDGITHIDRLEISPDRRNVIFEGTYERAYGSYLVPTLGGDPKRLTAGSATFWAGGDSIISSRAEPRWDSTWLFIANLDGVPSDSIRVRGPADYLNSVNVVPGSNRILYAVTDGHVVRWHSIDRTGRRYAILGLKENEWEYGAVSADALWLNVGPYSTHKGSVVRIPFYTASGKFGKERDTVYFGNVTAVGVTADGARLLIDDGAIDYSSYAMPFEDMLAGKYDEKQRFLRSTAESLVWLTSDGRHILIGRETVKAGVRSWHMMPFPAGPERKIPGLHSILLPFDSATMGVVDRTPDSTTFSFLNLQTQRLQTVVTIPDLYNRATPLGRTGWAWVSADGNLIRVQHLGEKTVTEFKKPPLLRAIGNLKESADTRSLVITGFTWSDSPFETADSAIVGIFDLTNGKFTRVWSTPGGDARSWSKNLDDGSLLVTIADTDESLSFYRVELNGKAKRLGSTRRPTWSNEASTDLTRAITQTIDRRTDAWMMTVVR